MSPIVYAIYLALTVYAWLIVGRAVMSWLQLQPGSGVYKVYKVLIDVTEPYLAIFRRIIPVARIGGTGIDFSSVVALIVLFVVMQILVRF